MASLRALTASYYNSLSRACAELQGRSHGGGVLELMPNETEKILVPYSLDHSNLLIEVDRMFRSGKSILDVLNFSNELILRDFLGFSKKEVKLIEGVRCKLLGRRMSRGGKIK